MSGVAEASVRRVDFDTEAEQRYARIVESRMTIPWSEMLSYLAERAAGRTGARPVARKHPAVCDHGFAQD